MVKQKVVRGDSRHVESKSGSSFGLALLLHGGLVAFCPNSQRFSASFS